MRQTIPPGAAAVQDALRVCRLAIASKWQSHVQIAAAVACCTTCTTNISGHHSTCPTLPLSVKGINTNPHADVGMTHDTCQRLALMLLPEHGGQRNFYHVLWLLYDRL
jgi:hypothetical protein